MHMNTCFEQKAENEARVLPHKLAWHSIAKANKESILLKVKTVASLPRHIYSDQKQNLLGTSFNIKITMLKIWQEWNYLKEILFGKSQISTWAKLCSRQNWGITKHVRLVSRLDSPRRFNVKVILIFLLHYFLLLFNSPYKQANRVKLDSNLTCIFIQFEMKFYHPSLCAVERPHTSTTA